MRVLVQVAAVNPASMLSGVIPESFTDEERQEFLSFCVSGVRRRAVKTAAKFVPDDYEPIGPVADHQHAIGRLTEAVEALQAGK